MNSKHFFAIATLFFLPTLAFGQATYTPLVGIPGLADPGMQFGDYINALYALSISVAALIAVIKIIIAGVKYMLSDVVTSKSDAINDIQGAVFGLIIVISAVLILTVINPNLTSTEIFIDQAKTEAIVAQPVSPTTLTTGTGFSYAKAGTVPTFKADCNKPGQKYMIGDGNEYCFEPLPAAIGTKIETDFKGQNIAQIKNLYQTQYYPRLINDTGVIKTETGAAEVLFAVTVANPQLTMDKKNIQSVFYTCDDLQRASGKNVVYKKTATYLACVVMPPKEE